MRSHIKNSYTREQHIQLILRMPSLNISGGCDLCAGALSFPKFSSPPGAISRAPSKARAALQCLAWQGTNNLHFVQFCSQNMLSAHCYSKNNRMEITLFWQVLSKACQASKHSVVFYITYRLTKKALNQGKRKTQIFTRRHMLHFVHWLNTTYPYNLTQ